MIRKALPRIGTSVGDDRMETAEDRRLARLYYRLGLLLWTICAVVVVVFHRPSFNSCDDSLSLPKTIVALPLGIVFYFLLIGLWATLGLIYKGRIADVPRDIFPVFTKPVVRSYRLAPGFTTTAFFALMLYGATMTFRYDIRYHAEYARIHDRVSGNWFTERFVDCPEDGNDDR
jgi:hypothetical protein